MSDWLSAATAAARSRGTHTAAARASSDDDGDRLTIFGYGSLLSFNSCQLTSPSATNHRVGVLPGWQRVFSLVSIGHLRAGNSDSVLHQLAAVAISPCFRRCAPQFTVGALFEITQRDFTALCAREHRYEVQPVMCYEADDAVTQQRPVQACVQLPSLFFFSCQVTTAVHESHALRSCGLSS
jgi:hypothetical protein